MTHSCVACSIGDFYDRHGRPTTKTVRRAAQTMVRRVDPETVRRAGLQGQDRRPYQVRSDSAGGQGRAAPGGGQFQIPFLGASQRVSYGKTDAGHGSTGRRERPLRGGYQERRFAAADRRRRTTALLQEGGGGGRVLRHNIQGALQRRWRLG